jgi:hypothetical protein
MKIMHGEESDHGQSFQLETPEDLGEDSDQQEEEQIDIT